MSAGKKLRLGVNIDHVATVRNARGGAYPDPLRAAKIAQEAGADGITAHLREDRRHISDADIDGLMEVLTVPLNFEMAATDEMQRIALRHKPHAACIVPEKREERTTEGGLEVAREENRLAPFAMPMPRGISTLATASWRVCARCPHMRMPWGLRCTRAMGSAMTRCSRSRPFPR